MAESCFGRVSLGGALAVFLRRDRLPGAVVDSRLAGGGGGALLVGWTVRRVGPGRWGTRSRSRTLVRNSPPWPPGHPAGQKRSAPSWSESRGNPDSQPSARYACRISAQSSTSNTRFLPCSDKQGSGEAGQLSVAAR
jgi:hypothetical protein